MACMWLAVLFIGAVVIAAIARVALALSIEDEQQRLRLFFIGAVLLGVFTVCGALALIGLGQL